MLIITAHNDSTGKEGLANYDCEVRVNHRVIWRGRVENHVRDEGFEKLLELMAVSAKRSPSGK